MLKIYHAKNTRSVRIRWLCEELGIPYDLKTLDFSPEVLQSPEYLAIHPLGKVPAIEDEGEVMIESGAIAQHLLEKHGKGRLEPKQGSAMRKRFLHWFHFAEASLMGPISDIAQHTLIRPKDKRIPQVAAEAVDSVKKMLAILEANLEGLEYICGDEFTAADITLGYALMLCSVLGLLTSEFPKVKVYYERISSRPAFINAAA